MKTMWTFHTAERTQPTHRSRAEELQSSLRHLQHRKAELVRRLETLKERHALFPNEVSERQVVELARKLDELRAQTDSFTAEAVDSGTP